MIENANFGKENIEKSVLGGFLVDENLDMLGLDEDDFFYENNRNIFKAIKYLKENNSAVDLLTVRNKLEEMQLLDSIGGNLYLIELSNTVISTVHQEEYINILKNETKRIRLYKLGKKIMFHSENSEIINGETINWANECLSIGVMKSKDYNISNQLGGFIDYLESRKGKTLFGWSWGFDFLDTATDGLQPGICYRIGAPSNTGKAMPLYEKILTPNGYTTFGEIKVGDKIINSKGGISNVTGYFPQGIKRVYRVKFQDGSYADSCNEHLWEVYNNDWSCKKKVLSLDEIMKYNLRQGDGWRFKIKTVKPINFGKNIKLPIHPYVLGLLLADGHIGKTSTLQLSNIEDDVLNKFSSLLPYGDEISVYKNNSVTKGIKGENTMKELYKLGLKGHRSYEKFVPDIYKFASIEDRIELLRGMIDGDGYINKGQSTINYCTTSKQLSDDIEWLVGSLGGITKVTERITQFNDKFGNKKNGRLSYHINISINDIVLASSIKHLSKLTNRGRKIWKTIVGIEYIGEIECACISVNSEDSLYITRDFILTHNTQFVYSQINNLVKQGAKVLFFTLEMNANFTLSSILANHQQVSRRSIEKGEVPPDVEYLEKLDGKLFLVDDIYNLGEIFSKILEVKPDIVFLDFIGQVKIKGFPKEKMFDEYAGQVKEFVKKTNITWIDLSNMTKAEQGDEYAIRQGGFNGSQDLKNLADIGIHFFENKDFKEFKTSAVEMGAKQWLDYSILNIIVTKNRIGNKPESLLKVNFAKGGEFKEIDKQELEQYKNSFL